MKIANAFREIKKSFSQYSPSVEVLISRKNLIHNLDTHKKKYPDISFAPVLKSNAYGHGFIQVARILDKEKIPFFVVDSLYEAMALRSEGIKSPILVIGYTKPGNINTSRLKDVIFTIVDLDQLIDISRVLKKKRQFHLKIDTGMHRQGILPEQSERVIKLVKSCKNIELTGVCSHLADADSPDSSFTERQIRIWRDVSGVFRGEFSSLKYFHLSASSGVYYSSQIDSNVARLGIGLYGINTSSFQELNLKPVMEYRSVISSIKTIPAGEYIGYGITYKTKKDTKIATVPVGYFEGVDRRLSNRGFFKLGDRLCPIVGRVSMNIASIDVSDVPGVKRGDSITIISSKEADANSVKNIAEMIDTIPYEVLVHIPQHLRRVVI